MNNNLKSLYLNLSPQKQEMLKFLLVGGSLTVGWSSIATLLKEQTDLRPAYISAIAYAIMITIGYFSQRIITFKAKNSHLLAFPRYVSVQLLGMFLSILFSEVVIGYFNLPVYLDFLGIFKNFIAFGSVGCLTAVINFLLLKYWTFSIKTKS